MSIRDILIEEAWHMFPFRVEPTRVGHYRECPLLLREHGQAIFLSHINIALAMFSFNYKHFNSNAIIEAV